MGVRGWEARRVAWSYVCVFLKGLEVGVAVRLGGCHSETKHVIRQLRVKAWSASVLSQGRGCLEFTGL